jgi:hypothetical protein
MNFNYFYKYNNIYFVFANEFSNLPKNINSIALFKNTNDAQFYSKLQNITKCAVLSNNANDIQFWINKNIDYIVNPFDFKSKGFDKNTFSILIQNKILPIILLEKLFINNKQNQIQIFKHLIAFVKLCKKYKLPLIILSNNIELTYATYSILGYNEKQAERFLSNISDLNEE